MFRLLATALIVLVLPLAANAQWVLNGSPVSNTVGSQYNAVAVSDGSGGAIVAFRDNRAGGQTDIYAQHINSNGATMWAGDVAVCTAIGDQLAPTIVSDGAGGAIIAWMDQRTGTYDIYAQRVNPMGFTSWTANGVVVCNATNDQNTPNIVTDASGGAIICWADLRGGSSYDIYAQRLNLVGTAQWTANGVIVCNAANHQLVTTISIDGAGGAIMGWQDQRSGSDDVYAQRINSSGVVQWAANGVSICSATNSQYEPYVAYDGANGAVFAWEDRRPGSNFDIYAQRVNSAGVIQWPLDGLALCTTSGDQMYPTIAWDNSTGAIICWEDYRGGPSDIYAARITPAGSPVWNAEGTPVCTAANSQYGPRVVPDGAGGAVMAWLDARNADMDVYAQRIDASGLVKWANGGMPVTNAYQTQYNHQIVADGNGGAIVTWYDARSGPSYDIYAQHMEGRYGFWGKPEPSLSAVKDVPADQGGKVRLEWYASGREQLNQQTISHYTIWRAIDQAAFATALIGGAREVRLDDANSKYSGKALRHEAAAAADYYWELIGEVEAFYRNAYSFTANTTFDSTASNAATHRFQIVAHSYNNFTNWPSNVLSGRSVDNLAPPAPLFLTAQRIGNYVYLKWNGVHVGDLDKYTVYRQTSTGVTAIPGNFLSDNSDTLLTDSTAPASALYYIVTATDIHQNQSTKSNEASVAAATGVGGNLPPITALTVLQNFPNPFTGETQLYVGLSAKSDVRVGIYDVAGRRLRNILVPAQGKGWNTLRITARDDRGAALPSGVYFYQVNAGGQTVTKKMVIAR